MLEVVGGTTLDGTLDPELLNGFTGMLGETFTSMDYLSRSGTFASIENETFDNGEFIWG